MVTGEFKEDYQQYDHDLNVYSLADNNIQISSDEGILSCIIPQK